MRRLPLLLAATLGLLLAIALPAARTIAAVDQLAPDSAQRWASFQIVPVNQIRLTVLVDGAPVRAILDTGASYTVVSQRYAAQRRLAVRSAPASAAIGGSIGAQWANLDAVSIAGLVRRNARVAVVDLPDRATGGGIDVLIGRDLIEDYALEIDFAARRLRLLPSGTLPFAGVTVPLSIGGDWPMLTSSATLGGHSVNRLIIDTGDAGDLTLTQAGWNSVQRQPPPSSTMTNGIGGSTVAGMAVLPELQLGGAPARPIDVLVEPVGGFTETIGMNGRIGNGVLRRFHVLLDPHAGRMVLRPGNETVAPPIRSTSGLLVERGSDRMTVIHVMRASPAAADGWREGEQICRVDGHGVDRSTGTDWQVGRPGRIVRLTLCSGEARALTLRSFL